MPISIKSINPTEAFIEEIYAAFEKNQLDTWTGAHLDADVWNVQLLGKNHQAPHRRRPETPSPVF